ncbi:hypothetical protein ACLESD_49625 [Pyxidicoccus sp. 3LFB2]
MKLALTGIRAAAKGLGVVAPGLAAIWAERLFRSPRRTRRSRTAEACWRRGSSGW